MDMFSRIKDNMDSELCSSFPPHVRMYLISVRSFCLMAHQELTISKIPVPLSDLVKIVQRVGQLAGKLEEPHRGGHTSYLPKYSVVA